MVGATVGSLLWGAAGIGAGLLVASQMKPDTPDYSAMLKSMQRTASADQVTMPEVPVNPAQPVEPGNPGDVANPEAEDERRKLEEAAREAARTYNPTGGLGLTSNAPGKSKGLGGV